MPSTYQHIALPPNGLNPGVVRSDSQGRVRIPSSAKRLFAYLSVNRIDYRDIDEIHAATPRLYELKLLYNGTYQLARVHRIGRLGDQDFVLQEVMPGHLEAYVRLIENYPVMFEEASDARHLTQKHREQLDADEATLCQRIAYPPPAAQAPLESRKPTAPNERPDTPAPQRVSGPLNNKRAATDDSTEDPNKKRESFVRAVREGGALIAKDQFTVPTSLPMNAATTMINIEEMYAKLDKIAAQQNARGSSSNTAGVANAAGADNTADVDMGETVPIYDADGVFVMYDLPENVGTDVDMYDNYPEMTQVARRSSPTDSTKGLYSHSPPDYTPSPEEDGSSSPYEGLLMRGRDWAMPERGERERAPSPYRRRGG